MTNEIYKGLEPLDAKELEALPYLVYIFNNNVEKNLTNGMLNALLRMHGYGNLSSPRIRKMINHIRNKRMCKGIIIAGSKGYTHTFNAKVVREYLESLEHRENAIKYLRENISIQLITL